MQSWLPIMWYSFAAQQPLAVQPFVPGMLPVELAIIGYSTVLHGPCCMKLISFMHTAHWPLAIFVHNCQSANNFSKRLAVWANPQIAFCVGGSKERRQTILVIQYCFFNSCDGNAVILYSGLVGCPFNVLNKFAQLFFRNFIEQICAWFWRNCSFCDKSMKLGTLLLNIIKVILRNGAASNLTFGDLQTSKLTIYGINIEIVIICGCTHVDG
jgi:hypothetical protein